MTILNLISGSVTTDSQHRNLVHPRIKMKIISLLFVIASTSSPVVSQDSPFVLCGDEYCNTARATCDVTDANVSQCICFEGYTGTNCVENLDECNATQAEYPCKGPNGTSYCVNESPPMNYKCGCVSGYNPVIPDNITDLVLDPVPLDWRPLDCIDIDECSNSTLNNCADNTVCENTEGGFTCICNDTTLVWNGVRCTYPITESPTQAPTRVLPPGSPLPPSTSGADRTTTASSRIMGVVVAAIAATVMITAI
jgi:hypothetical protein